MHREVRPGNHEVLPGTESCGGAFPVGKAPTGLEKGRLTRFHAGGWPEKDIDNIQYVGKNA